ncbi:hypothetical protein PR202_ga27602 [Eleusine coracana subsp. coracana]|uniref:Uncharacterized protein n=1 Tax=Eleusine coracana subsp. coracana TaxID=191504 RepID=A0AAV5DF06_ELECO|nr:hypothetical protein PR202_ga27580 [Eleusine coracana subsp. coracana]GJN09584.1 hypothetical protein PR202_ga27602 [Eleusine coracana subsp. coracana]
MAKATGCVDKRTRKEMFTQDQVQEMISQHAPSPCPAIPAAEGSASHQDASKSSDDEGTYQSSTEDDDDDDEDYVDS